eukprot:scaffold5653_cov147-Cylindrotheca_fusiformis.AAC.17
MFRSFAVQLFARSHVRRCSRSLAAIPSQQRGMADFTMTQIKELRGLSGAPIVECKKALTELNGDVEGAMDWLRKHGAAKATQKVSGRDAEEGLVSCVVSEDGKSAALVKVSSETDFAGKSPAFVDFVTHVAESTLESGETGNIDAETVLGLSSKSKSVQLALEEAIVAIRENLGISSALKLASQDGMLVSYVHGRVHGSNAGSSAAVVELVGTADAATMQDAGKKLAMHIVAAKPSYLNADSVPSDVIEKEKEVLQGQIADSNKPPEVIEKIIDGRMRKFYTEVCLTEQEHMVEEGNPQVAKALKKLGLEWSMVQYRESMNSRTTILHSTVFRIHKRELAKIVGISNEYQPGILIHMKTPTCKPPQFVRVPTTHDSNL